MKEALKKLSEEQLKFICNECNLSKSKLFILDEDALYDQVYDVMCDIELEEIPADNTQESKRCIIASSIVTELGNALAEEQGYFNVAYEDEQQHGRS